jgi:hypothetical protein
MSVFSSGGQPLHVMNASNAYPAEMPLVQDPLSWLELLVLGIPVLIVCVLAIIAPRRRGHMMIVTDVLRE